MRAPKRHKTLDLLVDYLQPRVQQVLENLADRGFEPILWETLRTRDRQDWLWQIGRTRETHRKPVTWTRNSRHMVGKAADIICAKRLWDHPEFFDALAEEAQAVGMHVLRSERCHIEWRG